MLIGAQHDSLNSIAFVFSICFHISNSSILDKPKLMKCNFQIHTHLPIMLCQGMFSHNQPINRNDLSNVEEWNVELQYRVS